MLILTFQKLLHKILVLLLFTFVIAKIEIKTYYYNVVKWTVMLLSLVTFIFSKVPGFSRRHPIFENRNV